MVVWTVANQKGGVGKTTTTVALAGLAAEQGLRVLLLDLDPHGSLSSYFRQDPDTLQQSTFTLFNEKQSLSLALLEQVIHPEVHARIDLIPASTALATVERRMSGQDGLGLVVSRALALLKVRYDLVIIDTPPLLGVLLVNALAACDQLIIPVQTEFLALKGLERMTHTLKMMARSRSGALPYAIVPVMFDRRTQASVSSLRTIRYDYPDLVWPGKIPIDTKLRDASKAGVPPHALDADSQGISAYRSLYKWLRQRDTLVIDNNLAAGGAP
ncbi:MAG TPA: ParA family protein [Cellvibrionaceae bacterium]